MCTALHRLISFAVLSVLLVKMYTRLQVDVLDSDTFAATTHASCNHTLQLEFLSFKDSNVRPYPLLMFESIPLSLMPGDEMEGANI